MPAFYWERHPDGPFATLIAVATSYLHPEIDDIDSLKRFAKIGGTAKRPGSSSRNSARRSRTRACYRLANFSRLSSTTTAATRRSCGELWHDLYGDETP